MPVIRANRDSVDDRFSVLGFSIRTESPLFEVGISTDPALFRPEQRDHRHRRNFFSSRVSGALRARRGEAVYLVPPEVMAGFVGQQRLYFGLATYGENSGGVPNFVQAPTDGNMYVNIAGLTERGLRRLAGRPLANGAGATATASLIWGGDTVPAAEATPAAPAPPSSSGGALAPPAAAAPYDDGFGPLPAAPAATTTPSQSPAQAPAHAMIIGRDDVEQAQRYAPQWADLFNWTVPPAIAAELGARGMRVQRIQDAAGALNLDRYEVRIDRLPSGFSAPALLDQVRTHLNEFVDTGNSEFLPYTVGTDDVRWGSATPAGAVFKIDIAGPDNAAVVGSLVEARRWRFTTIWTQWSGDHPVSGHREFGIRTEGDTEVFYTRAADRSTQGIGETLVWAGADHLWRSLQTRLAAWVNANGGSAAVLQPFSERFHPEVVRILYGASTAQSLGLNRLSTPVRAQEIITPFYDPSDPASALTCQNDAFSPQREEWFAGVPDTRIFPHSAICLLEMKDATGQVSGRGTGFYVGPNRILTAGHNLHGQASVDIIPANNDTAEPFGRCNVTASHWRVSNRYPAEDSAFDLAVIDTVPIAAPGGRWFEFLRATPGPGMSMVVCGYSSRSDLVPELTRAINGRKQHLHAGYVESAADETFDYPILTLKRASGSPVYHLRMVDGELKALVAGVHVSGEPAARGLNRGCFITPAKMAWIEGRTAALGLGRALNAASFAVYWNDVAHVRQTSVGSCWAAAAAMVAGWARRQSIPDTEIAAKVPILGAYAEGLLPQDRPLLSEAWDLVPEPPASYPLTEWCRLLESYGPLWVATVANVAGQGGHIRVLIGMDSDGNPDGSDTRVYVLDPATVSPDPVRMSFSDFLRLYEGRLANSGRFYQMQILHAADTGGRRPGSAPPARVQALTAGSSFSLNWDGVTLIAQPTHVSCWAAAAAMVIGWRDNLPLTAEDIATITGRTTASGLDPTQVEAFAREIGLTFQHPQSYSIDAFSDLLEANGPLWVGAAVPTLHAIVVTGLYSDGSPDGADTFIRVTDPWDRVIGQPGAPGDYLRTHTSGSRYILTWADFVKEYEAAATDYRRVNLQILHSGGTFGRQPNRGLRPAGYQMALEASRVPAPPVEELLPATPPPPKTRALEGVAGAAVAIAGVVLERVINNQGDITWELDQFRGIKHPNDQAPGSAAGFHDATALRFTDWPKVENHLGDQISAGFSVEWQYNGRSLGNVRITNVATNDAVGWGLAVRGQIMDDNAVYASQDDPAVNVAALRVRLHYRFTRVVGADLIAVRDVHLFGDGTSETSGRWEQR